MKKELEILHASDYVPGKNKKSKSSSDSKSCLSSALSNVKPVNSPLKNVRLKVKI